MKLNFGNYLLDIDVGKTKKFYQSAETITQGCQCSGCRNFQQAVECFPDEVKQFFEQTGIAPDKSAEVYVNCSEEHGRKAFYGGFYHLCGEVLKGESDLYYPVAEGYSVGFFNAGNLIEEDFPEHIVQMEIEFHVPWVLDEENEYR